MITNFEKPEILSPAGDMDCLKSALNFGADAVFLAGKMFGMRSAPQNFDNDQLKKACDLAHAKGARIHVTCNTLPRNNEIPHLQECVQKFRKSLKSNALYTVQCAFHFQADALFQAI